jgi:hypothetical protein
LTGADTGLKVFQVGTGARVCPPLKAEGLVASSTINRAAAPHRSFPFEEPSQRHTTRSTKTGQRQMDRPVSNARTIGIEIHALRIQ